MFHRKRHHQQHCLFSNSCWLNRLWVNLLTGMLSLWIVCGAPESLYKSESPSRTQRLNVYFFMYDWWIKVMHVYMCVVCTYAFHTMGKEELIQMDTHCRSMNRTVRNINASKHTCIQEKMIFAIWNAWHYNWFFYSNINQRTNASAGSFQAFITFCTFAAIVAVVVGIVRCSLVHSFRNMLHQPKRTRYRTWNSFSAFFIVAATAVAGFFSSFIIIFEQQSNIYICLCFQHDHKCAFSSFVAILNSFT